MKTTIWRQKAIFISMDTEINNQLLTGLGWQEYLDKDDNWWEWNNILLVFNVESFSYDVVKSGSPKNIELGSVRYWEEFTRLLQSNSLQNFVPSEPKEMLCFFNEKWVRPNEFESTI